MNQSKLETRPRRRSGTRRPFVVAQTIVPAPSRALKTKLATIACHGKRGEPVAGDGEGRERPDPVHERDVAPGHVPVPHHHGGEHRADAAEREDEPEIARRPVHVVLDDERQQDLGGTPEDQVRERRGQEGAPQPHARADEAEPLLDVLERGLRSRPRTGRSSRARMRATHAIDTTKVSASIRKAGPGFPPQTPISHPPIAGPIMRAAAGRMNWSREFAWFRSAPGTSCGTIASKAGPKNAVPAPNAAATIMTCQSSQGAGDRQQPEGGHAHGADRVGRDHHPPPVEPVAHHTADQAGRRSAAPSSRRRRSRARSGRSTARRPATRARRGRCRRRSATRSSRSRAAGSRDAGAAGGSGRDPTARSCITPFARPPGGWTGGDRGPRSLPGSPRGRVVPTGIPPGRRGPSGRHRATARRRR